MFKKVIWINKKYKSPVLMDFRRKNGFNDNFLFKKTLLKVYKIKKSSF